MQRASGKNSNTSTRKFHYGGNKAISKSAAIWLENNFAKSCEFNRPGISFTYDVIKDLPHCQIHITDNHGMVVPYSNTLPYSSLFAKITPNFRNEDLYKKTHRLNFSGNIKKLDSFFSNLNSNITVICYNSKVGDDILNVANVVNGAFDKIRHTNLLLVEEESVASCCAIYNLRDANFLEKAEVIISNDVGLTTFWSKLELFKNPNLIKIKTAKKYYYVIDFFFLELDWFLQEGLLKKYNISIGGKSLYEMVVMLIVPNEKSSVVTKKLIIKLPPKEKTGDNLRKDLLKLKGLNITINYINAEVNSSLMLIENNYELDEFSD